MLHARKDYNRIQDPEGLIPQDEPVFLLRAKDMNAPAVVRLWADIAASNGADANICNAALAHADKMEEWQSKHGNQIPDMPE